MQNSIRYTIFKTKWGYFGLLAAKRALIRTRLPIPSRQIAKTELLKNNLQSAKFDKTLFKTIQEQITAYFEGTYVDFHKDIPIAIDNHTPFQRRILYACRTISYGTTINYGNLAKLAGSPNAARAAGSVMANNNLPLIIPCHRIISSSGSLGGFSAIGGTKLKKKMLDLEQKTVSNLLPT